MERLTSVMRKGSILFCLALLGACADDNPWRFETGEGGISPTITTTTEVRKSVAVRSEGTLEAPDADQFGLTLQKMDGTYSKTWASVSLFPTDEGFKVGTYTMSAAYGNLEDEGFERPYFYGEKQFEVLEDRTTDVEITASLANSMVSIAYTDAFRRYFSDWQAKLHSEGGSYIDFPKQETRPAYLKPGHVDVALTITKPNGVTATLQPAEFDAEARHHYRITLDVYEGEVGEAQLVISFDDTLDEENITIDLSDELLTTPAPEVTPQGFTAGEEMQLLELTKPSQPVRYFIRAKNGITAATMTVQSSVSLPVGQEFDFCALTSQQNAAIQQSGIKETGLSRNPGTMAQIDLTEFIGKLPAGTHKFTLVVKDKMTKINEPLELTVVSVPLTLELTSVYDSFLGSTDAALVLSTNAADPADGLSIEGVDNYGARQNCPIKSVTEITKAPRRNANGFPVKQYDVQFTLPTSNRDVKIYVNYKGQKSVEGTVKMVVPEYTVEGDAFAHKTVLKVKGTSDSSTASITKMLRAFVGNTELNVESRHPEAGLVIVNGLSAAMQYNIQTTVLSGSNPEFQCNLVVTTENEDAVPNGDFETLQQTYAETSLNQGGQYTRTLISSAMQNHQAYTISEPTGWASSNAKTLNKNASTKNSWFTLASVFNTSLSFVSTQATQGGMGGSSDTPSAYQFAAQHGANAIVIRNTAWDPAGTLPAVDKKTAVPSGYYSSKIPEIGHRSAGLFFLGTYSYDGTEVINEGVAFAARPSQLTGYYRYIPDSQDGGEQAVVTVKLMNGNTVIGTGTANLNAADGFTTFTVPITYSLYFLKADKLCIMFKSSNRSDATIKTTSRAERYLQESTGATLVIDNLSFKY